MGILQDAYDEVAFAKIGMLGFPGGGKTYTAVLIAIGLAKEFGDGRPVAMFDTEKGSDWIRDIFKANGIKLLVAKRRSFKDLIAFTKEAEKEACVSLVDSVTHPWGELIDAAQKRYHTNKLKFHHWGPIKQEWSQFADWFLNVPMHAIICGRAGFEYSYEKDDDGDLQLLKTGTKMRAESQFGFEPSLVLELEAIKKSAISGNLHDKGIIHRCYVLKDRSRSLEGSELDNPGYEDFRPLWKVLNPKATETPVDTESRSAEMLDDPEQSRAARGRKVQIALDEIKNEFIRHGITGTAKGVQERKIELLESHFGTNSWTAIEAMRLEDLITGLQALRDEFMQEESPEPTEPF